MDHSCGRTPLHDACDGRADGEGSAQHMAASNHRYSTPFKADGFRSGTGTRGEAESVSRSAGVDHHNERGISDVGETDPKGVNIARLLVNAGADPAARTSSVSAKTVTVVGQRPSMTGFGGGSRNREGSGMTPLHLASRNGSVDLVGYLIRAGASVSCHSYLCIFSRQRTSVNKLCMVFSTFLPVPIPCIPQLRWHLLSFSCHVFLSVMA